jgi:transcriptional regulator with XRE-family HTH domain
MYEKLKTLREAKNIKQKDMAPKVSMDQSTYSNKENGKSPITDEEWERFANVLGVKVEEIKEEKQFSLNNNNCTFNEGSIGIQYINIPKDYLDTLHKYIKKLEDDLEKKG